MMLGGVFSKKSTTPKYWAIAGIIIILAANILEFFGYSLFNVDTKGMLRFDSFGLATGVWKQSNQSLVISIAIGTMICGG